jgi:Nif-specific regulatory protein
MAITLAQTQQRLQRLTEISELLMSAVEPERVVEVILEAALQLFEAEGCSLALLDDAQQQLAYVIMAGPAQVEEFRVALGQGIGGWVAQTGEGVVCNDVAQDPRWFRGVDHRTGFTTRSILCAPLKQHNQLIGVIQALNTVSPEGFSAEDLQFLTALGGLAGMALVRTQTFARVRNAGAALQEVMQERYRLVRSNAPAMQEVLRIAHTVAATNTTVLLLGESGTGKEVVARAIHQWSPRAEHPFIAINCVALTPDLLASELFGHEKGSFTGATAQKKGKFELADGGTLFLDEIGELAPELQAKLLRVLQDKEFQRVGGIRDIRVDVRILAATNRDLHQAMRRGTFREDLYYRLNVVALTLPALHERRADIPPLVYHFITHYSREVNRPGLSITQEAVDMLQAYRWPGNVRELQNAIERAMVLSSGPYITLADFPAEIRQTMHPHESTASDLQGIDPTLPLNEAVEVFKRVRVQQALTNAGGNQSLAAKALGLQPSNLSRLMSTLRLR